MTEYLGSLGRSSDRVILDDNETYWEREFAEVNGQDEWADELDAELQDNDRRRAILWGGLR